ncbi:MAG: hypothetical protein IPM17_09925 [Verrucomicrobia bacterium]|jgi:adenylyltransferase/sulfurtransferase|nr:hypothetical protein [Verrucomicrobiota bacterium]
MLPWEIEPRDLAAQLRSPNPPRLLDVRQPDEHALVALPQSTLLPLHELPARMGVLATWRHEPVVVYCHHGMRSLRAVQLLRQAGFDRAVSLAGGIDRWAVEVDPTLPRY